MKRDCRLRPLLRFVKAKAESGRILWENDAPVFRGLIEALEPEEKTSPTEPGRKEVTP